MVTTSMDVRAERAQRRLHSFLRLFAWPILAPATPFVDNWHIGAICEHIEAIAAGEIKKLLINMPFRMLKPVAVDTMVVERSRGRIRIDQLHIGDGVLTHRGRFRRVTAIQHQGELDVLKVETFTGRSVLADASHPFLTPRGWINAEHLRVGDTLGAVTPQEPHGDAELSDAEARLLGYLVGDGSCSQEQTKLTNDNQAVLADFQRCAEAAGFHARLRHKERNTFDCILRSTKQRWTSRSVVAPLTLWKIRHGIKGATSYTKRVPAAVLGGTQSAIASFLGAYWSCDGTVAKSARDSWVVRADTVSEGLARDVQHLLLRLGVSSHVRSRTINVKTARQGDQYLTWYVYVPADQQARFAARVPIAHDEKARRLQMAAGGAFDRVLFEDAVAAIAPAGRAQCMCIAVEGDSSFSANDIAVHNSTIVSQAFPAWDWINSPHRQFLTAAYAMDVATRDAVDARRIIESDLYQRAFGDRFKLTTDQNVKTRYENDRRGRRIVTATESAGTGFGGDIRIVDDPVSAKKADSVLALEASIEWWRGTMATRANDPATGAVIIVHQRLNPRDLTGYLLAEETGWTHLVLPMRFDPALRKTTSIGWTDPRTEAGELLHPARLGEADVVELERSLGGYHVAAQMQQQPSPRGGILFSRSNWRFYRALPELDEIAMSVDCTFKDLESSDFVAIQVWGAKGAERYLVKRLKARMSFSATVQAVRTVYAQFPNMVAVLIEDKANGSAVIDTLRSQLDGVIGIEPAGGKVARAYAMQPAQEAGNIFLPDPEVDPDIETFLTEVSGFPTAVHDDEVDAMTQYVNWQHKRSQSFGILEYYKQLAEAQRSQAA